jgi:phosphoglycolate phosphatase-like HAD superfamily hydrolase
MVGDTDSDIQFGKNLGMKTILMKSAEINTVKADLEISNLTELVDFLIK